MDEPTTDGGTPRSLWRALAGKAARGAMRTSLLVTPRPMALLLRREFAKDAARYGAALLERAPKDVVVSRDERYGTGADERYDLYRPPSFADGAALPTVVWVHGGAFIGGAKEDVAGYVRMLAGAGFAAVAPRYSLAPGATYPTPVRQVTAALGALQRDAARLHLDPHRIVLAGDSAGAQISAQVAAVVTNPAYADLMGIRPTIPPEALRGVVLCCGVFDPAGLGRHPDFREFMQAVGWSYSGTRHFRTDERFTSTITVGDHLTSSFPPAFLTVGNADPLDAQSRALAATLADAGVEVDTLFYPPDHEPPLAHEYQWELHLDDARVAFDRIVDFLRRHTA
jgi:acetyl esterase/lipase